MTCNHGVPIGSKEPLTGMARIRQEHAKACWNSLLKHCQVGPCTCNIDHNGILHILEGCLDGRHAYEEYKIAFKRCDGG